MENIIGHRDQLEYLINQVKNENLSHSYLFEGVEGIGKKKVAMFFSKLLLCKNPKDTPCGTCSSCIKFDSGNHPDFKLIEGENGTIKKSQIDEVVEGVKSLPFESKYKVYLIRDSENMNRESMNGLLKTLEEPPAYMRIILTTSKINELLPTVISRCQLVKFYPLLTGEIFTYLKSRGVMENQGRLIANISNGSIARAIELIEDEKLLEDREYLLNLLDKIIEGNNVLALTSTEFFEGKKDRVDEVLDIIILWFRDLAIYKETKNLELIINRDKVDLLKRQSHLSFQHINGIIENVEYTKRNIKNNVNFPLSIELMLLNIRED